VDFHKIWTKGRLWTTEELTNFGNDRKHIPDVLSYLRLVQQLADVKSESWITSYGGAVWKDLGQCSVSAARR